MAKLVEADLILSKLGLLSENFGQNMSYDTNGSLDRALELAKKTVIIQPARAARRPEGPAR